MGAAKLINGKIEIDSKVCNHCGRCIGKCPFKIADDSTDMFKIYIGGRWGKKVRMGTTLNELFTKEEALRVIEKAILFFKDNGLTGERFAETIDRMGIEQVEKSITGEKC